MKNGAMFLGVVLLAAVGCLTAPGTARRTCYVSPSGDDANPGTRRAPFATLERARDAARQARTTGAGGWTVCLLPGRHERTAPFVLEPEDSGTAESPVVYRAAKPGTAVVSGGFLIRGWRAESPDVWSAEVPGLREGRLYFEQLFVNGRRAVRARHPNVQTDWRYGQARTDFLTPAAVGETIVTNGGLVFSEQRLTVRAGELDKLAQVSADELKYAQLVVHHNWDTTRRIVLGFDAASGTLLCRGEPWKPWNPWRDSSRYAVENLRSAFDVPGEWFLSPKEGRVFYRPLPGDRLDTLLAEAPRAGVAQLVVVRGDPQGPRRVVHVLFEDLVFGVTDSPRRPQEMRPAGLPAEVAGDLAGPGPTQFAPCQAAGRTEAAILADGASGLVFARCTVEHTGEYGIWLRHGCTDNRIARCRIADTGAGGVRLGAPPGGALSASNSVTDCEIVSGGRFHASATAVWIGQSSDNQVAHNRIADHFYTGVSAGWVWGYQGGAAFRNTIASNIIEDIGQQVLGDMGGVYTLGTSHGTRVVGNIVRRVDSYTYGGWGLYTDEGSEGILMADNLVVDVKDGGFHQHYGRGNVIRNNIFAFSRSHQVAATRVEAHESFVFERNIVCWRAGQALGSNAAKVRAVWRNNVWFCLDAAPDFSGRTFAQWQADGRDVGGLAGDPLFRDADGRDFRLRPESSAPAVGFEPFDFFRAGVRPE